MTKRKKVQVGSIVRSYGLRGQARVEHWMKTMPGAVWLSRPLGGFRIWNAKDLVVVTRIEPKKGKG